MATHLLDAGMPMEFVQDHLGHQSIRSTSIYARITDRRQAEVFAQLERSPWIVRPATVGHGQPVARLPRGFNQESLTPDTEISP
jgi:hypothetical protein